MFARSFLGSRVDLEHKLQLLLLQNNFSSIFFCVHPVPILVLRKRKTWLFIFCVTQATIVFITNKSKTLGFSWFVNDFLISALGGNKQQNDIGVGPPPAPCLANVLALKCKDVRLFCPRITVEGSLWNRKWTVMKFNDECCLSSIINVSSLLDL